jgi:hypothetical protein
MTGFDSKRQMAQDKLDEDDMLTIVYAQGFADGKKATQRKPLTDEQKNAIVYGGPVYAPDGRVTRTPDGYRKEIEAHRLDAIRRTEAAHNIKE